MTRPLTIASIGEPMIELARSPSGPLSYDRRYGGDTLNTAVYLARLLAGRGDEAGLARRIDAGDAFAGMTLASLLVERGDEAGLVRRADAGDQDAAGRLAALLAERGDVAELARRADAWDVDAARLLAELLVGASDAIAQRPHDRERRRHVEGCLRLGPRGHHRQAC